MELLAKSSTVATKRRFVSLQIAFALDFSLSNMPTLVNRVRFLSDLLLAGLPMARLRFDNTTLDSAAPHSPC